MKTIRTIAVILLVGVVVTLGVLGMTQSKKSAQVNAQTSAATVKATRGDIEEIVSATGSVAADRQSQVVFSVSGIVDEVSVAEGDRVTEGQTLARLDDDSLQRAVAKAEASLKTAQERLAQAKRPASEAELAQAQAKLDQAKRPACEAELGQARAAVNAAKAKLAQLKAGPTDLDIQAAQLNIDSAKNSLWGAQAQRDATKGSKQQSDAAKDQAEANVLVAEVNVQKAQVALEQVKAPARAEELAAQQAQVDQAEAQLAQLLEKPKAEEVALAEAQLAQLKEKPYAEEVAVTQAQVEEAALALKQAQEDLADALLAAPFDGTVMQTLINEGEWIAAGSPAIVLADTQALVVDVMLDEVDVAQISEGQVARLIFEALPHQQATGVVTNVAPGATETSNGVAYKVKVLLDPTDLPIKPGMTTNVDIVTAQAQNVVLVPNRAITADRAANKYYVTKQNLLGVAERVEVKIGLRNDDYAQVLEGVDEGDTLTLAAMDGGMGGGATTTTMPGGRVMMFGAGGR